MAEDWSNIEVEIIIADYMAMLKDELRGIPIHKTNHRNKIKTLLKNRSNGSIEYKHQNISAVLIKLGLPFIKGYKPAWNFQTVLEDKIIDFIKVDKPDLENTFLMFSEQKQFSIPSSDFSTIVDSAPIRSSVAEDEVKYERKPIKINYLEMEQCNSTLGKKGEELAIEYEKWRLISNGRERWAEQIEWVANTDDGAGFDILSKNDNGSDRYIEVKTTKLSKETPIYFSKGEFDFSHLKKDNYFLYRFFNFSKQPKLFCINGDFDSFCRKEATHYKGYF